MLVAEAHDPLLLLVAGLVIDAVLGDMPALFAWLPHPVVLAGRMIARFDRRLNRDNRSARALRDRGIVTVVVLVGGAAAVGWAIAVLCGDSLAGAAIEAFVIATLIAQRGPFERVAAVAQALQADGAAGGRASLRGLLRYDPASLDGHGVARAAIERLAAAFATGVVAPVFWFLLLGLPGLFAYTMAAALDHAIGYRTPRYRAFGWAAARFDDLATLVPAPLGGVLLSLAALFAKEARAGHAVAVMLRDGRKHGSPAAGWPQGAVAGALGLALAGPRRDDGGSLVAAAWVGDGKARATPADIGRALRLYTLACLIQGGLLFGVWLARHAALA